MPSTQNPDPATNRQFIPATVSWSDETESRKHCLTQGKMWRSERKRDAAGNSRHRIVLIGYGAFIGRNDVSSRPLAHLIAEPQSFASPNHRGCYRPSRFYWDASWHRSILLSIVICSLSTKTWRQALKGLCNHISCYERVSIISSRWIRQVFIG
jgi:hypothetical protein